MPVVGGDLVFQKSPIAAALIGLAAAQHCLAAPAPTTPVPSAGTVIQNVPQVPPPHAVTIPELRIQKPTAEAPPTDATQIPVVALNIEGNTLFSTTELLQTAEFKPGVMTLAQLRAMTTRMADSYHQAGYFLAQVIIPAQDIDPARGTVVVRVLEGRYGAVTVRNKSALHDFVVPAVLGSAVQPDAVIAAAPLERGLLLMADLPGVTVQSTLTPGQQVGTSDLLVDVDDARRVQGSIDVDNEGNVYTGRVRIGGTLQANDLLGLGDQFTARVFGATNGLLQSGRASYAVAAGPAQVGVAYTHMVYWLGGIYDSLSATGVGDVGSAFVSAPLLRSRTANVSALFNFDDKYFKDDQRTAGLVASKSARVFSLGVNGDIQDGLGDGGVTTFGLTDVAGRLDLHSADARAADFSTTRTNGSYNKLQFNASRLQRVGDSWSFYADVNGQMAGKNLDVSEKMELGGVNAVRAYPEGEAYGDQGAVANVEARWDLPVWDLVDGHPQLIAFVDGGRVVANKNNWTGNPDRRTLGGAGLGVNLSADRNYAIKFFWAHKVDSGPVLSQTDSASRVWLQLVKYL
jgi:hemolysin activation/secretion protein